ncbi:hypothetical protein [Leptospira levettii]|uniref:SGNH/GDSL hydrolase family protein n=1 Tax=Leptospira levettii TaxID=2023178 RepID=A0ABY2MU66_9LEPT|nr:hypothetical protein [Leptospira levettii]TGL75418.1 hypothetical protein EHQ60_00405 [Leptospira levettii]
MKNRIFLILFIFLLGSPAKASQLSEFYAEFNSTFNGIPTQTELLDTFTLAFLAKNEAELIFNRSIGQKCLLKNSPSEMPRGNISEADVINNNRKHVIFWGDSMTDWVDRIPKKFPFPIVGDQQVDIPVDPYVYYGSNWNLIDKRAVGGTTSEDLRRHFDKKGGVNPSLFFPNPASDNHINLENRNAVILYGGNDIVRYESLLKALPFLTVFRHNAVVNNLNRIVTYHQAQGAKVLILGHTPRPSVPDFNFFGDFGVFGDFMNSILGHVLTVLVTTIDAHGQVLSDIVTCINMGRCHRPPNVIETSVSAIYSGAKEREAEKFLATALNMSASKRTDSTWVSQQLAYQTIMIKNLVAMQRNTEYMDEWAEFADWAQVSRGQWWAGNPTLYEGDSIHFSHPWGHSLHATLVSNKLNSLGWWSNPTPSQGDRCNFTSSATFQTGQPVGWTPEPPELPEANEDAMLLLLLCFYFGVCSF